MHELYTSSGMGGSADGRQETHQLGLGALIKYQLPEPLYEAPVALQNP